MARKSTIQNNFGDPQIKTSAPADKQPVASTQTSSNSRELPSYSQYAEEVLGKPAFQSYEHIEVVIDTNSAMFTQLASRIHDEICRIAKAITQPGGEYLTLDEVESYLSSLVKMRVLSTTGKLPVEYRKLPALMVHPFVAVIIDQIGLVRDVEFGLDFEPVLEDNDMLSPLELLRISEAMFRLEPAGLRSVGVMVWKDTTGSLEFMSLQHLDGMVRGMKVNHTVYGFFGSLFNTMAVYSTVGLVPRVVYGYDHTYRMYLDSIFNRS